MDQMIEEVSERGKQKWLERVKREFQNGPLASNVVFGFILTVLERLVETEFECPCKGTDVNRGFVASFFIIPGILAFVLMASVQGLKCSCDKDNVIRFFHCLVPAFVWTILLVFDGRYIACGKTDWSGRYVTADKATPLKWCEPENGTSYQDRLKDSQDWYFHSQRVGLGLVLALALVLASVLITNCIMNKPKQQQTNPPAEIQPSLNAPPEASKEGKQEWLERVKREFQNGPLASNVVFGFILTVLERLVETEFECPCKEKCNGGFVAAFFIIPGILAFVLMASVQRPKCSCHCLVPAFVWMILLVFDGRYIACAMTDWSGRYVTADKATPLKWCEPENGTSYQDRLKDSQDWYFHSQWAGLGLVFVLALGFLIIICIMNKEQPSLHALPDEAVQLQPVSTNTPDTKPTEKA
ncbi:uncharacterized protein LOC102082544 isoform X2 [Oreochromis niloticus]|uniref:uncharacterized protein LOC102082544 isoform X2 n=1 Tax=Oreochromis niloticus TaxID=8128 RepID=UPI000904FC7A|nr:uncharacterized protein LOC102082544 isoform X2 [Oreochromis niloticus]XP_019222640.1 uncharacterized protein LOC102082544 isoform X2 [Oreochromis niloticus]